MNILSPILLEESRLMVSPSDSSLSLSLLAERRCEELLSGLGVGASEAVGVPVSAGCIWTTGMGVSRLANVSALDAIVVSER